MGKAELISKAKLAEQAERYEDMAKFLKEVVDEHCNETKLEREDRNLLSVAYKNIVGSKRASWRVVNNLESKAQHDDQNKQLIKDYRERIEEELETVCNEVLQLIDKLIAVNKDESDVDGGVFFLKMKGDYCRYKAEVKSGHAKDEDVTGAREAYDAAQEKAEKLEPTDPIRLGLALNYSVFLFEIQNKHKAACVMAKNAFDNAIAEIDHLQEEAYKDSTLIMQLLRDNLALWTSEDKDNENDGQQDDGLTLDDLDQEE